MGMGLWGIVGSISRVPHKGSIRMGLELVGELGVCGTVATPRDGRWLI